MDYYAIISKLIIFVVILCTTYVLKGFNKFFLENIFTHIKLKYTVPQCPILSPLFWNNKYVQNK